MDTPERPQIETIATGAELRQWDWEKSELVDFARAAGLLTKGGTFDLLGRISHYLDTGSTKWQGDYRPKPSSRIDWHTAELGPDTVITVSYKNTQNVRRFFKSQLGPDFKFNIVFMAWIKANVGATLADAVAEYNRMNAANVPPRP